MEDNKVMDEISIITMLHSPIMASVLVARRFSFLLEVIFNCPKSLSFFVNEIGTMYVPFQKTA